MADPTKQCCERIYSKFSFRGRACRIPASLEFQGRHYCKTHHPPTKEAKLEQKRQQERAAYERQAAVRSAVQQSAAEQKRRAECYPDLLAALQAILQGVKHDDAGDGYAEIVLSTDDVQAARAAVAKATGEPHA